MNLNKKKLARKILNKDLKKEMESLGFVDWNKVERVLGIKQLNLVEQVAKKEIKKEITKLNPQIKLAQDRKIKYDEISDKPDVALKTDIPVIPEQKEYDDKKIKSAIVRVNESLNVFKEKEDKDFSSLKEKISDVDKKEIEHSELLEVKPDQHHKELHTIDSHIQDELLENLYRLAEGGFVDDLHKHKQPKIKKGGGGGGGAMVGSSFTKEEADGLYLLLDQTIPQTITLPNYTGQIGLFDGFTRLTCGTVEPTNPQVGDLWIDIS